MKKLWLTSLFFLLIISSFQAILYSQILGSIKGHVYDKETKVPLEKVIVTIISQKSEAIQYKLITDKKGYFYKSGLHIGIYMIKFEKKGYAPGATTIRIGIGSKEDLKISLPPFKGKKKGSNRIVEQSAKLINSGNFSEAITKLSEAIKDDPENYVLYYYRGYCFEKNKEYDRAIGDYQKSMKLNPEFLLAIQGSGNSYAKKKEFNNAIKFYQKAIELGNTDIITHYNYGISLVNSGDSDSAITIFEKLLSLDPNYPDALYEAGILYLGQGNEKKAREYLQKFIELDPENKNSSIAKQILATLK